jgi:hypothetical protein
MARLRAPGGGAQYQSFVLLYFDVLVPTILLSRSIKAGPPLYDLYIACSKKLVDVYFALGMTSYAPFITFNIIMVRYLYKDNDLMKRYLKNFFVHRSQRSYVEGGPCRGTDETTEEIVKRWKSLLSSGTEQGVEVANILLQGPGSNLRMAVDNYLGCPMETLTQRAPTDLDFAVMKMTATLNVYGPGRRDPTNNSTLLSLDGTCELKDNFAVDKVLEEGRKRKTKWVQQAILNGGPPPAVSSSFLNDTVTQAAIEARIAEDLASPPPDAGDLDVEGELAEAEAEAPPNDGASDDINTEC